MPCVYHFTCNNIQWNEKNGLKSWQHVFFQKRLKNGKKKKEERKKEVNTKNLNKPF